MLEIQSRSHPYRVLRADGVREALRDLGPGPAPYFFVDRRVAELHREGLAEVIPDDRRFLVDATEEMKSYERLVPVFEWLLGAACRRDSRLVVIGGGITQDIGCFVASVLFRGLQWTLVPTTLLAQCDSCIGAKSSLNVGRFKNQLGTFYPPHEVRLAFEFLGTLSPVDILSGLGEAIKLHLVDGEGSVARLRQRLARMATDPAALHEVIADSLAIKKRFIEADEFDRGVRNVLNYGHTFGHAMESATRYAIPHGIGVTLGIACATFFSERLGLVERGTSEGLTAWLRPYFAGHERTIRDVEPGRIIEAMKLDKKNQGDGITFILTRGPGRMEKRRLEVARVSPLLLECLAALCPQPVPRGEKP
jgi:3-dehydroquinate synthase